MVVVDVKEIKNAIKAKYGKREGGCFINDEWFSPSDVLEIIDAVADMCGIDYKDIVANVKYDVEHGKMKAKPKGDDNMTDQQIKVMFSKEILKLEDASAEMCIRRILFCEGNDINWQNAYKVALEEMPEFKNYKADRSQI